MTKLAYWGWGGAVTSATMRNVGNGSVQEYTETVVAQESGVVDVTTTMPL